VWYTFPLVIHRHPSPFSTVFPMPRVPMSLLEAFRAEVIHELGEAVSKVRIRVNRRTPAGVSAWPVDEWDQAVEGLAVAAGARVELEAIDGSGGYLAGRSTIVPDEEPAELEALELGGALEPAPAGPQAVQLVDQRQVHLPGPVPTADLARIQGSLALEGKTVAELRALSCDLGRSLVNLAGRMIGGQAVLLEALRGSHEREARAREESAEALALLGVQAGDPELEREKERHRFMEQLGTQAKDVLELLGLAKGSASSSSGVPPMPEDMR